MHDTMTHNQFSKGTHDGPEIKSLFSKRTKTRNYSRISDSTTTQYYIILYNKNVLFVWRYQVSLNLAF